MKYGKNICKTLKEIRQKIAQENDIPIEEFECTYEGDCNGTCPHCDEELRYIESELEKRKTENHPPTRIELPEKEPSKEDDYGPLMGLPADNTCAWDGERDGEDLPF